MPPLKNSAPSSEDWDRHKATIRKLWIEENKTLPEVISAMTTLYGHKATTQQYKRKFARWRFEKKNRNSHMKVVKKIMTKRQAQGKKTAFRVRNRDVTDKDVNTYFRRTKKVDEDEDLEAADEEVSTPASVQYWTPAPTRVNTPSISPSLSHRITPPSGESDEDQYDDIVGGDAVVLSRQHSNSSLSLSGTSTPQEFILPEMLFHNIRNYFAGCFESQTWVMDAEGRCVTALPYLGPINAPKRFNECCRAATKLWKKGQFENFRHVVRKALDMVDGIIQTQDPGSFQYIVDALMYLVQNGLDQIAFVLLQQIRKRAKEQLPRQHPWRVVCTLLGGNNIETFRDTIASSWRCATDSFETRLGPYHEATIRCQADMVFRCNSNTHLLAERDLRGLLLKCQNSEGWASLGCLSILLKLGYCLYDQGRFAEAEEVGLDLWQRANETNDLIGQIYGQELCACSQYNLSLKQPEKALIADYNMRESVRKIQRGLGHDHPWAVGYLVELSDWLKVWGKTEQAEVVEIEAQSLIDYEEA